MTNSTTQTTAERRNESDKKPRTVGYVVRQQDQTILGKQTMSYKATREVDSHQRTGHATSAGRTHDAQPRHRDLFGSRYTPDICGGSRTESRNNHYSRLAR